jgi:RNA polymerase sigma-70 factor (ECF subfamily)
MTMTNDPQRKLFTSYLAPVLDTAYGAALYLSGDPASAEALVQRAAVSAFTAFPAARPGSGFKVWFLRILTQEFLARGPGLAARRSGEAGRSPELERGDIAAAFAALPAEQRAVCVLYFVDDFSYAEMAEMTGCVLETARARLHEGRARLQALLTERLACTAALGSGLWALGGKAVASRSA